MEPKGVEGAGDWRKLRNEVKMCLKSFKWKSVDWISLARGGLL